MFEFENDQQVRLVVEQTNGTLYGTSDDSLVDDLVLVPHGEIGTVLQNSRELVLVEFPQGSYFLRTFEVEPV